MWNLKTSTKRWTGYVNLKTKTRKWKDYVILKMLLTIFQAMMRKLEKIQMKKQHQITVYFIKKLMFYACRTGTGTGVLCATGGRAMGTIQVLRWPYCLTKVEARWWYSFGETIQNVSRFWNRCGSHGEEETAILIKYCRINGVPRRWLLAQLWAGYWYGYGPTCRRRR